jgi:hypothetical protein
MLPESRLVRDEIILREMELPPDVLRTKKSLVRWCSIAFGMIYLNESRELFFNVFEALINFHLRGERPTTKDIIAELKSMGSDASEKTVYYHLLRLKEAGIIGKRGGEYFFGDGSDKPLCELIKAAYEARVSKAFLSIHPALSALENYRKKP